jgi:hypothetical protein
MNDRKAADYRYNASEKGRERWRRYAAKRRYQPHACERAGCARLALQNASGTFESMCFLHRDQRQRRYRLQKLEEQWAQDKRRDRVEIVSSGATTSWEARSVPNWAESPPVRLGLVRKRA